LAPVLATSAALDDWLRRDSEVARGLLARAAADEHGAVSPSVYETSRLVRAARWLDGHGARLRYLVAAQQEDGTWGPPDGYALVPTLGATEALLAELRELRDPAPDAPPRGVLLGSAAAGLRALCHRFGTGAPAPLPDTIAVETLVPWLLEEINGQLARLATDPVSGLDCLAGARLRLPAGLDGRTRTMLRDAARSGRQIPEKYWHGLEVLGEQARQASFVRPVDGAVGASPAATAVWLGSAAPPGHPSTRYLRSLQHRYRGPVPGVAPITVFERAWVLGSLAGAGMELGVPAAITDHLRSALGPDGAPAGIGLPPDSDDTAGALHALALVGRPRSTACLRGYRAEAYFRCFPEERTPSTSTNAHVLDALADDTAPEVWHRQGATIDTVAGWLLDQQQPDGSWQDKWHASAYYATACCVQALRRVRSPLAAAAVGRALAWVLDTQRPDGSWGRWAGTGEETAYAIQVLLPAGREVGEVRARAALAGCRFLLGWRARAAEDPPLWHDKDLYAPGTVVEAAQVGGLHLAASNPHVRRLAIAAGAEQRDAQYNESA
jgi:halimadienyl-diphosphate synthase